MEGKRQANCFKPFKLIPISVRFHMRCHSCPTKLVTRQKHTLTAFHFQTKFHLEAVWKKFAFVQVTWVIWSKKVCIRSNALIACAIKINVQPFEWLAHPFGENIHPFKRLARPFDKNVQLFKPLAHPFGKNFQPSERFAHSSIGTSIHSNSLS